MACSSRGVSAATYLLDRQRANEASRATRGSTSVAQDRQTTRSDQREHLVSLDALLSVSSHGPAVGVGTQRHHAYRPAHYLASLPYADGDVAGCISHASLRIPGLIPLKVPFRGPAIDRTQSL
jgi:hypothetical protein